MKCSDAEYHADKSLSKSAIDLLLECPARYKAWLDSVDDIKKTDALIFGSMCHKLILEPATFNTEYAVTNLNLATTAGKEWKAKQSPDIHIIKEPDYEQALLMSEAVRDHPQAKHLFKDCMAEKAIFWQRPDGIKCKIKPDLISTVSGFRFCADVKSTENASPEAIQRSILNYKYHRQAAWYLDGLAANGQECEAFIFIFVEKKYPYLVTMCQLEYHTIQQGREDCERAVEILKECQQTGTYPCYTRDILTLSLPTWAFKKESINDTNAAT